jgi:DNA-binding transcriptional LysR family regulator
MLDAGKLATLDAVLEHGSFSAAGKALGLTQPAVSRQVALLERQLGIQLVRRSRSGVRATEAGRVLAAHAGAVTARLEQAEQEIAELAGLQRGRARLGSFFTAFAQLAPEIDASAQDTIPDVALEHELVDRPTAFQRLTDGELDLAVVFEHDFEPHPPPATVRLVPLFADPVRVLLPAAHRLAHQPSVRLADLAGETWLRAHDGGAARLVDHVLATSGLRPRIRRAGRGDEPVEGQVYVVAGAGVMLAHELNVIVDRDGIAVKPIDGPAPARFVQAAVPADQRAPAARAVLGILRQLGKAHAQRRARRERRRGATTRLTSSPGRRTRG